MKIRNFCWAPGVHSVLIIWLINYAYLTNKNINVFQTLGQILSRYNPSRFVDLSFNYEKTRRVEITVASNKLLLNSHTLVCFQYLDCTPLGLNLSIDCFNRKVIYIPWCWTFLWELPILAYCFIEVLINLDSLERIARGPGWKRLTCTHHIR